MGFGFKLRDPAVSLKVVKIESIHDAFRADAGWSPQQRLSPP
jgi:hypothetical protein